MAAEPVTCPEGLASIAVVLPVVHRATVRAVVPLGGGVAPGAGLPRPEAVVRGWEAQRRVGLQAQVPDPALQAALDVARLQLLVGPEKDAPAEEGAVLVGALSRLGRHREAGDLVRALWSRQRTDGSFDEPAGGATAGGPHLWALGEHLRTSRDTQLAAELSPGIVAAEGWLRELEAGGRLAEPARRWAEEGRLAAAAAARPAGAEGAARVLVEGSRAVPDDTAGKASPDPAAAAVLRLHGAGDARRGHPAVVGPAGFDVTATLAAAAADLLERTPGALERLTWLLQAGGPTWSWPDHLHPRTGAGSAGSGASRVALAGFLLLVRDLLVTESEPGAADIVPVLPDAWRGQPLEVGETVLAGGTRLSFAVRWHGTRPALLWEVTGPLRLTARGLDPTFVTVERRGEALLAEAVSTSPADDGTVELS